MPQRVEKEIELVSTPHKIQAEENAPKHTRALRCIEMSRLFLFRAPWERKLLHSHHTTSSAARVWGGIADSLLVMVPLPVPLTPLGADHLDHSYEYLDLL